MLLTMSIISSNRGPISVIIGSYREALRRHYYQFQQWFYPGVEHGLLHNITTQIADWDIGSVILIVTGSSSSLDISKTKQADIKMAPIFYLD